jgi:hypothetical protein
MPRKEVSPMSLRTECVALAVQPGANIALLARRAARVQPVEALRHE